MNNLSYYISHYPKDPRYWEYTKKMVDGVLISHANLYKKNGNPTDLLEQMKQSRSLKKPLLLNTKIPVILDSGAYQFISPEYKKLGYSCEDLMDLYFLLHPEKGVHLDWPILDSLPNYWKKKRLEITEANAEEFIALNQKKDLNLIGAVQGYGKNGRYKGYGEMADKFIDFGYKEIGIGGVARLVKVSRNEVIMRIMDVVNVLKEYEDIRLHLFGVGTLEIISKIAEIYPNLSFDNATPTFSAIKRELLFYDGTYRRYRLKNQKDLIEAKKAIKNCDCYACKKYGENILNMGNRELNLARMIHNYYHYYRYIQESNRMA